jgi:ferric-dicitrate binding protein FerR (iron transport regulator)
MRGSLPSPNEARQFESPKRRAPSIGRCARAPELEPGETSTLRLRRGSVRLVVTRRHGEPFRVATEAAEVAVLGTEFDVTVVDHTTEVRVVRGEVEVRNARGSRRLWPKEAARARPGEAPRMVLPIDAVVMDGPAEIASPRTR